MRKQIDACACVVRASVRCAIVRSFVDVDGRRMDSRVHYAGTAALDTTVLDARAVLRNAVPMFIYEYFI